jgi:hypothetical protein
MPPEDDTITNKVDNSNQRKESKPKDTSKDNHDHHDEKGNYFDYYCMSSLSHHHYHHNHQDDTEYVSVVGDRSTDVELAPVRTIRSHDWSELGSDPLRNAPHRTESDYYVAYSENGTSEGKDVENAVSYT